MMINDDLHKQFSAFLHSGHCSGPAGVGAPFDRWKIPDGNDRTGQTCHILYVYGSIYLQKIFLE